MADNQQLLADTLRAAPAGDLYVFAYGSLMWRPGFAYRSAVNARVFGYNRRCAVRSTHYRGTPRRPGLALGLDGGGSCGGVLYRVAARDKAAVVRYLFAREMFADAYHPRYVAAVAGRQRRRALTFVVRRGGPHYSAPMPLAAAASVIRKARGAGGANSDYFHNTRRCLQQRGIVSPMLARLCRLLEEREGGGGGSRQARV